jgi:high-affinity nickel-transport protein
MANLMQRVLDDGSRHVRSKVVALYTLLLLFNAGAWAWAFIAFHAHPVLLGTALLAYTFGLRHAVDADHIAAIDNVTRKLMQDGERPVGVGLFFSLGHSSIVVLLSVAIAATATAFKAHIEALQLYGGVVGTLVSASFLLAIALMNILVLISVYRTFRHVKAGGTYDQDELNLLLGRGTFLARIFRPMFATIRRSWHMYPLGVLFGLGFDTATEVGLLGISAAEGAKGLSVWSILVFPTLFTAGMSLIDSTDSVLMLGAYGWAFVKPLRKLYYNITITSVSIVMALLVGGIEALGLIGDRFNMKGAFWDVVGSLNGNFGSIGFVIIGVFIAAWVISAVIYRVRGYDRLEARNSA